MFNFGLIHLVYLVGIVAVAMAIFAFRRSSRQKKDTSRFLISIEQTLHIPPTLHPVIDLKRCIGSLSCIQACPEGDILGIIRGKAALVVGANCVGHGKCEAECPVDAISLVFGTAERGIDLPEVSEFFESSRSGVHIVGELGGMGLIKNTMRQGVQVGQYVGRVFKSSESKKIDHALIVGAGPAGIAAALSMKEQGLSFRIVSRDSMGGTIANYPRQKIVMSETIKLPIFGKFGKSEISKEELLATLQKAIQKANIKIEEGIRVDQIHGEDGNFKVVTNQGTIAAQKVILAIGRMGTPRKLNVPGEEMSKVTYLLTDPEQYQNSNVLIVGGGNSAVESAIMIAESTNAVVSISCKDSSFVNANQTNKVKIAELISQKKIAAFMNSSVKQIHNDTVLLDSNGESRSLKNNFVIVNIGGVLPTEFLKNSQISMKRHHGEVQERRSASREDSKTSFASRAFIWTLAAAGILILVYLAYVGRNYYWLPTAKRVRSPLHEYLKPGGSWGHGVGIVATLVMLSNFFYAFRKNFRFLKGQSSIRNWLKFHMFVGFMSPVVILFHAAFQLNNMIATVCYISMLFVVGTGIIGRFLYGLIPTEGHSRNELPQLQVRIEKLKKELNPILQQIKNPQKVHLILKKTMQPTPDSMSIFQFVFHGISDWFVMKIEFSKLRPVFTDATQYREFCDTIKKIHHYKRRAAVFRAVKHLMGYWRITHVGLAIVLVAVIVVHIYTSVQMGFRWKF